MRMQELLKPEDILCGFDAPDKWVAIDRLMEHLHASGHYAEELRDKLHEAVNARERSMSTGMEKGIAIPHAAVEGLEEIVACMAIDQRGLNFESIDGQPARFVVLLVIPKTQKLLHIRTLADVARILAKDEVRERLLSAESAESAWYALRSGEA